MYKYVRETYFESCEIKQITGSNNLFLPHADSLNSKIKMAFTLKCSNASNYNKKFKCLKIKSF